MLCGNAFLGGNTVVLCWSRAVLGVDSCAAVTQHMTKLGPNFDIFLCSFEIVLEWVKQASFSGWEAKPHGCFGFHRSVSDSEQTVSLIGFLS